ncbi:MAG TPA: hypothetical protein PLB45_04290 [Bacilli bacterium]|nr:hypothetical protein [Bacilli bacterium]
MRESIGATWLMGIVMVFIALFASFLAFSINYSKAFRVKDGIVDRIERYNGLSTDCIDNIDDYLNEIGYQAKGNCKKFSSNDNGNNYVGIDGTSYTKNPNDSQKFNYCVQRIQSDYESITTPMQSAYYKVVVFFSLTISQLDFSNRFNVTGSTVTIYYPKDVNNIFN